MQVGTPEAMRALAHPLRLRILTQLEADGHGRAADLARTLGEPPNSVSFHLRTLARAGLVVEAPELAHDRRDRVWRNAADTYDVPRGTPGSDAVTHVFLDWVRRMVDAPAEPEARTGRARLMQLALTAEQAGELLADVDALVERWSERALTGRRSDGGGTAQLYNVAVMAGPADLAPAVSAATGPASPPSPRAGRARRP